MFHIGWLRGKLFIYDRSFIGLWPKDGCKWNAWVRDITAVIYLPQYAKGSNV